MKNFGGNITFNPKKIYTPKTEEEVLDILNKHKNDNIRAVGSLHAWSGASASEDVLVDLKYINKISIEKDRNGDSWAVVGGGCVLENLTSHLNSLGLTMPALGAIQRQTIAGAISTGTHGSGNNSISHHMSEIRIAAYDSNGQAKIHEFKEGDGLRAARCSIGCMGIILSVKFKCPKEYWLEEKITVFKNISDVLNGEKEYPLQQFGLIPFSWQYFAYQRRVTDKIPMGRERFKMDLLKLYDYLGTEILTHLVIKVFAVLSHRGKIGKPVRWLYKDFLSKLIVERSVTNKSIRALTLHTSRHDTFRHLEMEVFVPEKHIARAAEVIRWATSVFSGDSDVPNEISSEIKRVNMLDKLMEYKGHYTHHYPFFFRRIFPDDTLISMTSGNPRTQRAEQSSYDGDQIYYSVSFFTYLSPDKRERFYAYVGFMAKLLTELFDARLHWGKYFPLKNGDIERLYPNLPIFRNICDSIDPNKVFRNKFTKDVLLM